MPYSLVFSPEAEEQLAAIYRYIAMAVSPQIAERYTNAIVSYCEGLTTFPHRSTQHAEIRPGLRITNYKKRTDIAYTVEAKSISIIGIFYGGQNYQTSLKLELDI